MRVLVLSPYPERIAETLQEDEVVYPLPDESWPEADFVVSYGYRKIIKEPYLSKYDRRMVNIHLSVLPWNRGADPVFWSWFDNTPKGISIHHIDAGIDTGAPVLTCEMDITEDNIGTLESSYNECRALAEYFFNGMWGEFKRIGKLPPRIRTDGAGSYHRSKDKDPWMARCPLGWKTPVVDIMALGKAQGRA